MPVPFKLNILKTNVLPLEVMDQMAQDFVAYCHSFGLCPEDFGKEFTQGKAYGEQDIFKICGLKPRSHKYPIIAWKVGTLQRFKFGALEVKRYLETEKAS